MINRFLSLFVSLLVLSLASPYASCCCLPALPEANTATHDCCSNTGSGDALSCELEKNALVCKHKWSCQCQKLVFAGSSSADICSSSEAAGSDPGFFVFSPSDQARETVSMLNWWDRAPPKSVGMGSSLTYLFKRALLL